jgi:hypothetical protein
MGQKEVTWEVSPDEQRRRLREETPLLLEDLLSLVRGLREEAEKDLQNASPELREKYRPSDFDRLEGLLLDMQIEIKEGGTPLDTLKDDYNILRDTIRRILSFLEEKERDYRVVTDPETGERKLMEFKSQSPSVSPALEELRKLSSLPSLEKISISKDLVTSEFTPGGDILEIGTEEEKRKIRELQRRGKLLFGTMEGLSGGSAFFKSVSIALAKILNKQSQYYNPDGKGDRRGDHRLSGVPRDRIREVFGESAKLEKSLNSPTTGINGEGRDFPFILLSYEELAKEVSKTGKISGGKDIESIRLYINGGYREFTTDPKTGNKVPVKSSYVPGITSKKYPVSNGRGGFLYIPFVVNEGEIVDTTRKDPEVGCILRLSPQYSKTLRGYTALRSDTIQLIGGGRQKDITMDLLSYLAHSRNTTPVLRKLKSDILSRYENRGNYRDPKTGKRRVSKLEAHFKEAIQKSIEAKILQEYKEEITSGGEIICVFTYNPDYLKGEEVLSPDEQTGEE